MLCRGSLCDQPQIKILGAESLMRLSGQKHHIHVMFLLLEGKCALLREGAGGKRERTQEKASTWIPSDFQTQPVSSLMIQLSILTT